MPFVLRKGRERGISSTMKNKRGEGNTLIEKVITGSGQDLKKGPAKKIGEPNAIRTPR